MACRDCSQNDHFRPALDVAHLASAAARVKISLDSWDAGETTPTIISTDKAEASRSNYRIESRCPSELIILRVSAGERIANGCTSADVHHHIAPA
jgi:hypothetical protein